MNDNRTPDTGTGAPQGPSHYAWKGDEAIETTKRERAQRRYRLGVCEGCGIKQATDRHHVDGDTGNNARSNIRLLCRRCHMLEDGRLEAARENLLRAIERNRKPPRPCRICGRITEPKKLARDRCRRCAEYLRRTGSERPIDTKRRGGGPRPSWSGICFECGRHTTAVKGAPVRRMCRSCYVRKRRRGEIKTRQIARTRAAIERGESV